jgi:hypothetical protein
MPIIHKFKRFFQKVTLKLLRLSDAQTKEDKGEYESETFSICKRLINNTDSKLLISPISGKRYIKNDEKKIFIIIETRKITIVNHTYSYNIDILSKPYHKLVYFFDNEVEKRRQKMEDEIRSNVKHSLVNIYNNIINEKI